MSQWNLIVELKSYWHAGGGRGGGMVADAVVHRDATGLPVLPGKHLKGLLRDALERAERFGWDGFDGVASRLFGKRTEESIADEAPGSGCLRVADACLPTEIALWLGGCGEGKALLPGLFRTLHTTAVDQSTGSAKGKSLRGIEVTVPLRLSAGIEPIRGRQPPPDWLDRIETVLPLIDAVGAQRSRGLGRAVLTLERVT